MSSNPRQYRRKPLPPPGGMSKTHVGIDMIPTFSVGDRVNVLIPYNHAMAGIVTEIRPGQVRVKRDWSMSPAVLTKEPDDPGIWYEAYRVKPRKSEDEELREALGDEE